MAVLLFSGVFAQETEKKEKDKMKTEKVQTVPGGKDKVEVKKDRKVDTKDKGDVIDKTETTKQVKHTIKHKHPGHKMHRDSVKVKK